MTSSSIKWAKPVPNKNYIQIPQQQPVFFCVAYENTPEEFTPMSGWFKCREFFNDISHTARTGYEYTIYGFKTFLLKDGKWPLIVVSFNDANAGNVETFEHNWDIFKEFINKMDVGGDVSVRFYDKHLVLELSDDMWRSSLALSFITWLVKVLSKNTYNPGEDLNDKATGTEKHLLHNQSNAALFKILDKLSLYTKRAHDLIDSKHMSTINIHALGFFQPLGFLVQGLHNHEYNLYK